MRVRALILLLSMTGALAAGPAVGAILTKPDKSFKPPVPAAVDVGLRGALDAPKVAALSRPPPILALPAPGAGLATLSTAGLATPPAITPLRPIGDPAPICRETCAETRYVCATTDDQACDSKWSQCVADCSAPALR